MRGFVHLATILCLASAGCSLVLSPSRREGDAGAVFDAPGPDAPERDAPVPDVPGLDAPMPDVPGLDAPMPDVPTDTGAGCGSGLECVPAAPGGWSGPIVLVTGPGGAAAPSCPATSPMQAFTTRSGLTAATPTCGCSCTPPSSGPTCGAATLLTGSNCLLVGTPLTTVNDGACVTVSLPTTGGWSASTPTFSPNGTSCTAVPATTIPPIAWAESHRGCGFGAPVSCGAADVCAPARTSGERLCVYVDGDAACPTAYPNRIETAEDATDTRACSACTCGSVTGTCTGSIDIVNSCAAIPILHESIPVGRCVTAGSYASTRASGNYTPVASCTPGTVAPSGGATTTNVRTVCCL